MNEVTEATYLTLTCKNSMLKPIIFPINIFNIAYISILVIVKLVLLYN